MTLDADTVQNILEMVSDLKGDPETITDADRIRAVSRAERDFARRRFWRTHLLRNQTTTGTGSADYTIGSSTYPMRMKGLTEVFVGDQLESSRYSIVDYNTYWRLYNSNNAERMVYEWYDAANDAWKMHINPAPETGETIYYSYYWQPPKRTLTTDVVVCPNPKIIALMALAEIYQAEEEQELSVQNKAEAEMLIDELIGVENAPAVNQLYSVPAQTSKGYGTY